jgi:hypothetical protein
MYFVTNLIWSYTVSREVRNFSYFDSDRITIESVSSDANSDVGSADSDTYYSPSHVDTIRPRSHSLSSSNSIESIEGPAPTYAARVTSFERTGHSFSDSDSTLSANSYGSLPYYDFSSSDSDSDESIKGPAPSYAARVTSFERTAHSSSDSDSSFSAISCGSDQYYSSSHIATLRQRSHSLSSTNSDESIKGPAPAPAPPVISNSHIIRVRPRSYSNSTEHVSSIGRPRRNSDSPERYIETEGLMPTAAAAESFAKSKSSSKISVHTEANSHEDERLAKNKKLITFDRIFAAVSIATNAKIRSKIVQKWLRWLELNSQQATFDNILALLDKVTDDNTINYLAERLGEIKQQITFDNLLELMEKVSPDYKKVNIAQPWYRNSERQISVEQIIRLMSAITVESSKIYIAKVCLEKPNSKATVTDVLTLMNEVGKYKSRYKIANGYLKSPNTKADTEDVIMLIDKVNGSKEKARIANAYLKNPNTKVLVTDAVTLIRKIEDNNLKVKIGLKYLLNPCSKTSSHGIYNDIILLMMGIGERNDIAVEYLSNPNSKATFKDIEMLMHIPSYVAYESRTPKEKFAVVYLKNPNTKITFEEVQKLISEVGRDQEKAAITVAYLEKNPQTTLVQVKELMGGITDDNIKIFIAKEWLKNFEEEKKVEKLIELFEQSELRYNTKNIAELVGAELDDYIVDIANSFYSTAPYLKVLFYKEFIIDDIELAKKAVASIDNDNDAVDLIRHINEDLDDKEDLLEIIDGRIDKKFRSLSNIFRDKTIYEVLTQDGVNIVDEEFGEDALTLKAANLFTYYYMHDDIGVFLSVVSPKFIEEIKANFVLPETVAFLSQNEFNMINSLTDNKLTNLPTFVSLCSYIRTNKKEVPIINSEDFKINAEKGKYEVEQENSMNEQISNMLKSADNIEQENIQSFIRLLLQDEKLNFSEDSLEKLTELFNARIKEIAFILGEAGGPDYLCSVLYTINDGCVANIATNLNKAINSFLITDPTARLLDAFISGPMLAELSKRGSDILGASATGFDYLNERIVTTNRISPIGLVNALGDGDKTEYLKESLKLKGASFTDYMLPLYDEVFEGAEKAAGSIATLLALKKSLPEEDFKLIRGSFTEHIKKSEEYPEELRSAINRVWAKTELREYALQDNSKTLSNKPLQELIKACKGAGCKQEELKSTLVGTTMQNTANVEIDRVFNERKR